MKTKMGELILKQNSKKMDKLNSEMLKLAQEFEKLEPYVQDDRNRVTHLLDKYRANREEYARLQQQITDICGLEAYLRFMENANPKGS